MAFNLDNYKEVKDRIEEFWKEHPTGSIITDLIHYEPDKGRAIFRTKVFRNPEEAVNGVCTTGMAEETEGKTKVNQTSFIENGETSAIGRALANMSYGVDVNRPSRQEMMKVAAREKEHQKLLDFVKLYGQKISDDVRVDNEDENSLTVKDFIRDNWGKALEQFIMAKDMVELVEKHTKERFNADD